MCLESVDDMYLFDYERFNILKCLDIYQLIHAYFGLIRDEKIFLVMNWLLFQNFSWESSFALCHFAWFLLSSNFFHNQLFWKIIS